MPKQILKVYKSCLEQLEVRNSFARHIGEPHKHECGIPQGCPFSMVALALVMRPWILLMQGLKIIPRTLADDVMILACDDELHNEIEQGPSHLAEGRSGDTVIGNPTSPAAQTNESQSRHRQGFMPTSAEAKADSGGPTKQGHNHNTSEGAIWRLKAKFRVGFQTTLSYF